MPQTIASLRKQFGISRSTLLYYEQAGLLSPQRGNNGYRYYSPSQVSRLEQISHYRALGIPVAEIGQYLDQQVGQRQLLQQQFDRLGDEIQRLQQQQHTILQALQLPAEHDVEALSKERWTEIMRAAGLDDEAMHNWHRQFETLEPNAHNAFLASLNIEPDEIDRIRKWSRT